MKNKLAVLFSLSVLLRGGAMDRTDLVEGEVRLPCRDIVRSQGLIRWLLCCCLLVSGLLHAGEPRVSFDIPAQPVDSALTEFARQAQIQVLFPFDRVNGLTTKTVRGRYSLSGAARRLLAGTGLEPVFNPSGTLTIKVDNNVVTQENMMELNKNKLAAITALLAANGMVANAQDMPATGSSIQEVVVTAQFREQRVQDVPLAITAMDAEMLEARSQSNIYEVANQAPSVTLKPVHAGGGPAMSAYIRGIGQSDFNPALEPGVGIYVDDVYIPTLTGAMLELMDLERVEILRGPQGTLTGRNSIGGAIKLVSRKPQGDNSGFAEVTVGEADKLVVRGAADFELTDDLFMRVSGVSNRQDGYVDVIDYGCAFPESGIKSYVGAGGDCVRDQHGEVGYDAARVSLRYQPADSLDILFTADVVREDHSRLAQVLRGANLDLPNVSPVGTDIPYDERFICGDFCNYSTPSTEATTWKGGVFDGRVLAANGGSEDTTFDSDSYALQVNYDISDTMNLTSITAYREFSTRSSVDGDLSPANVSRESRGMEHDFFSQEIRINNEWADNLTSTVGLYYSDQESLNLGNVDLRYIPPFPGQFLEKDPITLETQAIFATLTWDLSERMTLTTGLRYTEEDKEIEYYRVNPAYPNDGLPDVPGLGGAHNATGEYAAEELDYRVSLNYRFLENAMAYVTVSTGYKGGGLNPRAFFEEQVTSFDSETLTAYELGFKSEWWDRRVTLNGAVFYNDFQDYQMSLQSCPGFGPDNPDGTPFGGAPCAMFVNIGDAEMTGGELELMADLTDNFSIDASASYIDFDLKTLNSPYEMATSKSVVPPFTPTIKWSLGAQYTLDMADKGSLAFRADSSYQDEVYIGLSNTLKLDDYILTNGRITWRNAAQNLSIALVVTNLTDEYYDLTAFDFLAAGSILATPGRPREWAVTVKKEF